jgi:hypothetical protein
MSRTSYANILALPDSALTWNFDLFFPSIPGGGNAQSMTYRCKTANLPGSKIEPVKIELHGAAKQEAGRAIYDHTFQATFMETVDYATLLAFRQWRDYMRSWKNNSGADSSGYKVNLEMDVYDNAGNVSKSYIIAGAFITEINEISYNGAESNAVEISLGFSFDYIDDGVSW